MTAAAAAAAAMASKGRAQAQAGLLVRLLGLVSLGLLVAMAPLGLLVDVGLSVGATGAVAAAVFGRPGAHSCFVYSPDGVVRCWGRVALSHLRPYHW